MSKHLDRGAINLRILLMRFLTCSGCTVCMIISINSSLLAGFMTNQEKELFMAVPSNEFNTYWIPCTWFVYRLQEASKKGKLINNYALETLMRVRRPAV